MGTTTDDLIRLLLRRWRVLFFAIVIGGALGFGLAATRSTSYQATAILLGHSTQGDRTDASLVNASGKVFQHSAVDPDVAGVAVRNAQLPVDPNTLSSVITATPATDSPLLAISAQNSNPEVAQKLANTVAAAVSKYSQSFASKNGYQLDKLSDASKPTSPSGPSTVLFVVAGIALAFLLAVFFIVARNTPDDEEEDVPELRPAPAKSRSRRKPAQVKSVKAAQARTAAAAPETPTVRESNGTSGTPTPQPAPRPRPASPRWKSPEEHPDAVAQGDG
jgi:capsular polysaccharide biosynthesis protein